MANIAPISVTKGKKLSLKKSKATNQSVKPEFKDYMSTDQENYNEIDYNNQFRSLSKNNNIGSIGDINKDGKVDEKDEKVLEKYLLLNENEKLSYVASYSHLFETSILLDKYKGRSDLAFIIKCAYNGEELIQNELTSDGDGYDANIDDKNRIIREFQEAFTSDEKIVGEQSITDFVSIVNGENIYYDINGDGKVDINDLTAMQKYNSIVKNYDESKTKLNPKINYSGSFENHTDYQEVMFTTIEYLQYINFEGLDINQLNGKTISECSLYIDEHIEKIKDDFYKIEYEKYVIYMKDNNKEPLSYDDFVNLKDSKDQSKNVDFENYINSNYYKDLEADSTYKDLKSNYDTNYLYMKERLRCFSLLNDNGFENYKIVEVVRDGSYDAVVLQDLEGNYKIFNHGTKSVDSVHVKDFDDYIYDAKNPMDTQFINGWLDQLLSDTCGKVGTVSLGTAGTVVGGILGGPAGVVIGGLSGAATGHEVGEVAYDGFKTVIKTYVDAEYEGQQTKAKNLADKYYNLASSENKKLYIEGYSLGGSLSEASYLNLADRDSANEVLGGVVLFNPYHDNLSNDEVKEIKQSEGFKLYCGEGDMVSTVFNYDDFKDVANYLYIDYDKILKEETSNDDGIKVGSLDLKNFGQIFGTTHMIDPYIDSSYRGYNPNVFAEDGSVRNYVSGTVYDEGKERNFGREVHGHSFEELNSYLFNGKSASNIDELGKMVVTEAAASYLGVNLSDDDLKNPNAVVERAIEKYIDEKI